MGRSVQWCMLVLGVLGVVLLAVVAPAHAATKAPDTSQVFNPTEATTSSPYHDFLPPVSDPNVSEGTGLACYFTRTNGPMPAVVTLSPQQREALQALGTNDPNALKDPDQRERLERLGFRNVPSTFESKSFAGTEISSSTLAEFRRVTRQAATVYDFADDNYQNGDGPPPGKAMRNFLASLKEDGFISKEEIEKDASDGATGGIGIKQSTAGDRLNYEGDKGIRISPQTQYLLKVTDKPRELYDNLPKDCVIGARVSGDRPAPTLGMMFKDFPLFLTASLAWTPNKLGEWLYNSVSTPAFKFSLFTPHVERGETFLDVFQGGHSSEERAIEMTGFDPANVPRTVAEQKNVNVDDTIANDTESAPWIKAFLLVRYLLALFYVLILVAGGFIYMVRGSGFIELGQRRRRSVLDVIPRMVLSIIFMLVGPALIGGMITMSNLFTKTLFNQDPSCPAVDEETPVYKLIREGRYEQSGQQCDPRSNLANVVTQQYNGDQNGAGDVIALTMETLTIVALAVAMLFLLLIAIMRQVILIGLVALLPLAAFLFMFARTQDLSIRYMKALVACIFLPVIMAVIIKLGISVNPLYGLDSTNSDVITLISALLMIGTLFLAVRSASMARAWVSGRTVTPLGASVMRGLGRGANNFGPLGRMAGAGLIGAGNEYHRTNAGVGTFLGASAGRGHLPPPRPAARTSTMIESGVASAGGAAASAGAVGIAALKGGGGAGRAMLDEKFGKETTNKVALGAATGGAGVAAGAAGAGGAEGAAGPGGPAALLGPAGGGGPARPGAGGAQLALPAGAGAASDPQVAAMFPGHVDALSAGFAGLPAEIQDAMLSAHSGVLARVEQSSGVMVEVLDVEPTESVVRAEAEAVADVRRSGTSIDGPTEVHVVQQLRPSRGEGVHSSGELSAQQRIAPHSGQRPDVSLPVRQALEDEAPSSASSEGRRRARKADSASAPQTPPPSARSRTL